MVEATLAGHRYSYCMLRGEWDELDAMLALAVERFPRLAAFRCARIWSRLKVGDVDGARAAYEAEIDQDHTQLRAPLVASMCQAMLAEVCFGLADATRAPLLEAALARSRCQNIVAGVGGVFHGPIQRYLGLLAAVKGELERAHELLAVAERHCLDLGAEPWALRIQLDQAKLSLRSKPKVDVAPKLREIHAAALARGWLALRSECDVLLPELAGSPIDDPIPPVQRHPRPSDSLPRWS